MNRNYFIFSLAFFVLILVIGQSAVAATSKQVVVQDQKPYRILHFVLRGVTLERAQWLALEAKKAGFNALLVLLREGVQLEHAPWKPKTNAWTKKEFVAWVEKVQSLGLEVIPEVKLLTHQEKLFQKRYPALMFNRVTYDPRKDEVYQKVFDLLQEIIEMMAPRAIHIGHDEVAGRNKRSSKKWLDPGDEMLPANLFLKDVLRLHAYLQKRNIETWMWGDMLISPDEFPGMLGRHLHGGVKGYGKELRDKMPKNIVICDWHYFDKQQDFPSLKTMVDEGFQVLGSTWKRTETTENFTRYAANHGGSGMIATTWFHVQKKEWDIVERIIRESGRIFLKYFPDAK